MKTVFLTADDYGCHPAVDAAVLDLIDAGRLSGAACMTRAPGWAAAATHIVTRQEYAGFGLHLDFTEFVPARRGLWPLIALSHVRRLDPTQLRDEIATQCARFEDATGRAPDYVDGHQHVHQLPQIRDALIEVLLTRYGSCLPWLRISGARPGDGFKPRFIAALGAQALLRCARATGFHVMPRLLGAYGFDCDAAGYRHRLAHWFAAADDGDAVMCHPATQAVPGDPIGRARAVEHGVLAGADFHDLLATADIQIGRLRP
ncbi:ChbG/HpnK family deacetylase [Methyloversatilis sp.]|uniref:ChbG/HpnK family deacetylase n=1 Tax=Methyloversatilis sp. TaxID=2569862 RepID=UPI002732F8F5|nr:ChbG/HpnK family deacetylase [Methyloversatilis sp.]MDP2870628.1 ChbG/HpnK family deacetylase [Methyloversatilis sp.]MDP3456495.1 ChbG/HpnK family deacetylase [Methyloversatilis sp.]MDP3578960.1 ChbG/HpnK family deacetylase [Methyloversatilis sp.]